MQDFDQTKLRLMLWFNIYKTLLDEADLIMFGCYFYPYGSRYLQNIVNSELVVV